MSINILSQTDMANAALDMVGGQNIQSISDTQNPNAELCRRHFGQCLKSELSSSEWVFARRFVKPVEVDYEAHPELVVDGYHAYVLPSDFGRLSVYFFSSFYAYRSNQYQHGYNYFLTDRCIYTKNELSSLTYISDNPSVSSYHPLFVDMLEASLGVRIAPKIMGNDANTDFLYKMYKEARHKAIRDGALQMEASPTGMSETQVARVL